MTDATNLLPALKVLLVEDNDELREATLAVLRSAGHDARGVPAAEDIQDAAGAFVPDVYVIDLGLPNEDGLSLTRRLRASHPGAGIIIATARSQIGDKVEGYESGADLYLSKPVHPQELLAGLNALGKRVKGVVGAGSDRLMLVASKLQLQGPSGVIELTASDAQLLAALARAPGQTLERWQIAESIGQGEEASPSAAMIEMRIARLRKKLVAAGVPAPGIKALRGSGYVLCAAVALG